ncbi:conserved oligomeric Golgi complex subunit 1-like [Teratosphaeria destructans]|uniref:Conserved oligomeric Golgi complex subunit 1 n=1 Tax=Teratosphaeria destructans TaxID=418781 RepID=A0A9W7SZM6_9PEZI|nr:conserved oligomeric Golgi complex subunit 1-like [Teratosphaeria destructans]
MATRVPDPRTLQTWDEAFKYPLPVVRKLEQQLRKTIDEDRSRLRSLVGASYRDLLGTAERIIEMDEHIRQVEDGLGHIGSRCNARVVERIGENHGKMMVGKRGDEERREKYASLAQTKVLQSALVGARRIIKAGGDALLAAKLLVLARLLHKSLSDGEHTSGVLDELQRDLGRLRKRLLDYVEKALVKETTRRETLAHTLCAYALVSSSAPKDVLRHFLQVRFQQIEATAEEARTDDVLKMLKLYEQTIVDTRALFPRLLIESLKQLTRVPLLDDSQVQKLHTLNLDIYGGWIAQSVRTFTPWVRHDQLVAPDVSDALASWSRQAQRCTIDAIKECLEPQHDADAIIVARKKIIMQFLHLSSSRSGEENVYGETIKEVRQAVADRLNRLAIGTAESLKDARIELNESSPGSDASLNLWELASKDMQLSHGARRFRDDVASRRHGRNAVLKNYISQLDGWLHRVDALHQSLQHMKSAKWDNELDVDLEDVPDGDAIKHDLNKHDPSRLLDSLRDAVTKALEGMYSWLRQRCADKGTKPALLLRLLRELEQRRKLLEAQYTLSIPDTKAAATAQSLHTRVVEEVIKTPLDQYGAAWQEQQLKVSTVLWDGTPPLPVQPTPATYKLLYTLHKAMAEAGTDLWSPHAVAELKKALDEKLGELISLPATNVDTSKEDKHLTNGHAEEAGEILNNKDDQANPSSTDLESPSSPSSPINSPDQPTQRTRDNLLQRTFDTLLLQRILSRSPPDASQPGLAAHIVRLRERLALEQALEDRLTKNAGEYWRRTYLLFGLLGV